jgi:hypothetical protein
MLPRQACKGVGREPGDLPGALFPPGHRRGRHAERGGECALCEPEPVSEGL